MARADCGLRLRGHRSGAGRTHAGCAAMTARKRTKRVARARPSRRKVPADRNAEIASLKRELSEALEQQTATSEVLGFISSSPGNLAPVFEAMLDNATRICEAMYGVLYRYDDGAFHPAAMHNVPIEHADFLTRRGSFKPPPGTPLDRLLKTNRLVQTSDEAAEPANSTPVRLGGARSLIVVPMHNKSMLVGAFVIYRREVRPFTARQIKLVRKLRSPSGHRHREYAPAKRATRIAQQQTATSEVLPSYL